MYTNQRLLDILTRHQVYIEGVKAYQHEQFNETLRRLDERLIDIFKYIRVKTLDELSRRALLDLIGELRRSQLVIYSEYTTKVIEDLKRFMAVELLVSKVIFSTIERPEGYDEAPISEADATGALLDVLESKKSDNNLFPFAFLTGSVEGNDKLWGKITNTPIPANGINLLPFIAGFTVSAAKAIENALVKGYANPGTTPNDALDEIRGTASNNYRDGALTKIYTQSGAVEATAIQFVSAIVQSAVASAYHNKYIWASVIDGRTTAICRSRNGNIYVYGKGPLPPAHINCRSKDIPINSDDEKDIELVSPKWFTWLQRQPKQFRDDYLKIERAKATSDFTGVKPVSPEEFKAKVDLMLIR